MNEEQRRALVEGGPVWLSNGLRASFVGWKHPDTAGVHSARPGFWACSWETAAEVAARPDRRFTRTDFVWRTGDGWLGLMPERDDFQTAEDYERALARGEAR